MFSTLVYYLTSTPIKSSYSASLPKVMSTFNSKSIFSQYRTVAAIFKMTVIVFTIKVIRLKWFGFILVVG